MVISNAWKGDPYPIDTLFMFMANMSWNSSMNTSGTIKMLTDKNEETGEYKIPRIIYSDAYYSEMVAYSDMILPDTTYLERWDCISLLDRPICEADAAQDAIRQPVIEPDRDVRPFQTVLIDLGARLGLPGLTNEDGSPKVSGWLCGLHCQSRTWPWHRSACRLARRRWRVPWDRCPNPNQLDRYIENGCFWSHHFPDEHKFFKFANQGYLEWAKEVGFIQQYGAYRSSGVL